MIINTSHLIATAFGISDLLIIMMPVFFGVLSGYFIRGKKTYFVAAAVPWFGLLAMLLFDEYVKPNRAPGASLWIVTQLFGGTLFAFIGVLTCIISKAVLGHYKNPGKRTLWCPPKAQ